METQKKDKDGHIVFDDIDDFFDSIEKETKCSKFVDFLYELKWKIVYAWERLYCRFKIGYKYHIIKTSLPPAYYYCADHRMLYGMMSLLKEFVEKERPFEIINWESDEEHSNAGKEIRAIYDWWNRYPNLIKTEEDASNKWYEYNKNRRKPDFSKEEDVRLFNLAQETEIDRYRQEQEMVERLAKIRQYLWT